MDLIDGSIVNLGFGLAQSLEDSDRGCLRCAADRRLLDDAANFRQASPVVMVMNMVVNMVMTLVLVTIG